MTREMFVPYQRMTLATLSCTRRACMAPLPLSTGCSQPPPPPSTALPGWRKPAHTRSITTSSPRFTRLGSPRNRCETLLAPMARPRCKSPRSAVTRLASNGYYKVTRMETRMRTRMRTLPSPPLPSPPGTDPVVANDMIHRRLGLGSEPESGLGSRDPACAGATAIHLAAHSAVTSSPDALMMLLGAGRAWKFIKSQN